MTRNERYLVVPTLKICVECETSLKFISIPTLSERYQQTHTAVNPCDHWNVGMFPSVLVYLPNVVEFILWKTDHCNNYGKALSWSSSFKLCKKSHVNRLHKCGL